MIPKIHLSTDRLLLRDWSDDDAEPFAAINADPAVMEFFPALRDRAQSDDLIAHARASMAANGYGLYAVELKASGLFAGFVGLAAVPFKAAFAPATEIGWRLARRFWGYGLATEGARAVLAHAFGPLALDSIVSFTSASNTRSRRVMERIGMTRNAADDFIHPNLPAGHPLAPHVLYRIDREARQKPK